MNVIVFSKNRACQLELLLRSMCNLAPSIYDQKPVVIYKATDGSFVEGYAKLIHQHRDTVQWRHEHRPFKEMVLAEIDPADPAITFFVDDMVFLRSWSPSRSPGYQTFAEDPETLCYSLRHSHSIRWCHPAHCADEPPAFEARVGESAVAWRREGTTATYRYAMSVDGHVYRTADILPLIQNAEFNGPNMLESQLNAWARALCAQRPYSACDIRSTAITIPANLVNDGWNNRVMQAGISAEDLNRVWMGGSRIKHDPFVHYDNRGVHEEIPYTFEECP